jgi:hypothetical protein
MVLVFVSNSLMSLVALSCVMMRVMVCLMPDFDALVWFGFTVLVANSYPTLVLAPISSYSLSAVLLVVESLLVLH